MWPHVADTWSCQTRVHLRNATTRASKALKNWWRSSEIQRYFLPTLSLACHPDMPMTLPPYWLNISQVTTIPPYSTWIVQQLQYATVILDDPSRSVRGSIRVCQKMFTLCMPSYGIQSPRIPLGPVADFLRRTETPVRHTPVRLHHRVRPPLARPTRIVRSLRVGRVGPGEDVQQELQQMRPERRAAPRSGGNRRSSAGGDGGVLRR